MKKHILLFILLVLASASILAQQNPAAESPKQAVQVDRGMSLITPRLMQVGQDSNFFLRLAEQIQLTDTQRTALEQIAYAFHSYKGQKLADLNVNDAEVERLLKRDSIDLEAVRTKIREGALISAEIKMRTIEGLLEAVNTLTHQQHVKIALMLMQELQTPRSRAQPQAL